MVPAPRSTQHTSRLVAILYTAISTYVRKLVGAEGAHAPLARRTEKFDPHNKVDIVFACLIPVLVLLAGLFAGLTLGYMSLDETQLNVLAISGTDKQREYANKIKPIRKNGHLLLVTLLLANMIVNETLPVISDPVLGGGVQSVVVSTVLIVIFSEIIPQSIFTRHGLYLGAKMAKPTKFLIYGLGIVAWPVAKLLEFVLGKHHGIIYRRAELKELIAMHSHGASYGGDLKNDTVNIIGATLDLQEKVVRQAMTPISDVFMLSIDSKLDYELLRKICLTGHSRVPVYEEVEIPKGFQPPKRHLGFGHHKDTKKPGEQQQFVKVKKIIGILLVKQCVLLDPQDAVPLRKIPLNKVPFVPNNEPLLGILDKFQEGRSHMAIVSRFSVEKAASVKKAVKRGLTQRLRDRVGMGDSSDEDEKSSTPVAEQEPDPNTIKIIMEDDGAESTLNGGDSHINGETNGDTSVEPWQKDIAAANAVTKSSGSRGRGRGMRKAGAGGRDLEMGVVEEGKENGGEGLDAGGGKDKGRRTSFNIPVPSLHMLGLEASMPADAVLAKQGADEFLQSFDPAVMPLGIITLEDVLEELIGEEIYDEFDPQGAHADLSSYVPPRSNHDLPSTLTHNIASALHLPIKPKDAHPQAKEDVTKKTNAEKTVTAVENINKAPSKSGPNTPNLMPLGLKNLKFLRSSSAPPTPREEIIPPSEIVPTGATPNPPRTTSSPDMQLNTVMGKSVSASPQPLQLELEPDPTEEIIAITVHGNGNGNGNGRSASLPPSSEGLASAIPNSVLSESISRKGSPALEAIIMDINRKRRLGAPGFGARGAGLAPPGSGTSTNAPSAVSLAPPAAITVAGSGATPLQRPTASGTSGKGARFKSSPIGGVDRAGIIIAEHVKGDDWKTGGDKAAPDK